MCMIVYKNRVEKKPQEGGTIPERLIRKKQDSVGVFGSLSNLLPFGDWTYDKR